MKKTFCLLAAPLLAAGFILPSALAQSSVSDSCRPGSGYDETAGGDGRIDAQKLNGPVGWDAVWNLPKTARSPMYLFREAAALTYPAITYPAGGGIQITPADSSAHEIGRRLLKGIPMKGHEAIYVSFLLGVSEKKDTGMAYVLFGGVGGIGAGISDGCLMVLIRQETGRDENGVMQKDWVPIARQPYQANTPYYFILKISDGGDGWAGLDEMSYWINPGDVSTESAASAKALDHSLDEPADVGASSGGISSLTLHTGDLAGVTVKFDEFRVGTTWESVTRPDPANP